MLIRLKKKEKKINHVLKRSIPFSSFPPGNSGIHSFIPQSCEMGVSYSIVYAFLHVWALPVYYSKQVEHHKQTAAGCIQSQYTLSDALLSEASGTRLFKMEALMKVTERPDTRQC